MTNDVDKGRTIVKENGIYLCSEVYPIVILVPKRKEGICLLMELFSQITNQEIFIWVSALCLVSLIVKVMLRHTYKRLLRAASDMGHSKHRLMKALCMKFETCYKLKIGVPNVSLFVEKYLRHYHVLGIYMRTWEHVNMLCVILVMAGSMGSSIWNMMQGSESNEVFLPLLTGIIGTGLLLFMDFIWNTDSQWQLLKVDITDYLENICKPRLENETFHPAELREYQKEYFTEDDKVVNINSKHSEESKEQIVLPDITFTAEEEKVIREVIQEYLG